MAAICASGDNVQWHGQASGPIPMRPGAPVDVWPDSRETRAQRRACSFRRAEMAGLLAICAHFIGFHGDWGNCWLRSFMEAYFTFLLPHHIDAKGSKIINSDLFFSFRILIRAALFTEAINISYFVVVLHPDSLWR